MSSHLINVRLDETYVRKAQALRDHGVVISDLVRDAIDARFDALTEAGRRPDINALVAALYADHPDDASHRVRAYDVHDRQTARGAIRRAISRGRP